MAALVRLARGIDWINGWIGRVVAWLVLAAVLVSAGNAVIRKSFNISSNAWLELQWYLFGAVFLLCAAWTLRQDEHVRVDVLASRLSPRARAIVDLSCHLLFLMPFAVLMVWLAWPFFVSSYVSGEQSSNAGGLIRWPAKLWVLLGFISFAAQGVSEIIKRSAQLSGALPYPTAPDDELPPVAREARS
ncbi:Tripartite ATP-independent periplasmic transporters, DctQ component [Roseivivax jejudonensis]|uniref:TRAP transporter small permease protein n=1 Tax=Roseivivax jejudonensis TaxID=1529041 RepID=A0A1X6ZXR1_9RHOB|nr:TRAP transporter small permease subunit [Roseivivax jejudonensis]SLN62896.1 Tripartite ATP-independent periplasmic transporters, DctQ component [Roseivivax jejudonensis]